MPCSQKIAVLFLLFCRFITAQSQSLSHAITVSPNGYTGNLAISGSTNFFFLRGDTTITMQADNDGMYSLNTGATIGGDNTQPTSYIYLSFRGDSIISIHPSESATIGSGGKSIYLHTAPITINPGKFNRFWRSSFNITPAGYYTGKKTIQLIKGLTYNINQADATLMDSCRKNKVDKPLIYGSYFYFTVNQNGQVMLYDQNLISAKASGSTLTFKTVCIVIDPKVISGGSCLDIRDASSKITIPKKRKLPFIRGTVNFVHWNDTTANHSKARDRYFHFLPL